MFICIMKMDEKGLITGILLGEAPRENAAESIASLFAGCPYCVFSTSFAKTTLQLFSLPSGHRWWLEAIQNAPKKILELNQATVFFVDSLTAETPWTRGDTKPILPAASCGADCSKCSFYKEKCPGCPATRYYKEGGALSCAPRYDQTV